MKRLGQSLAKLGLPLLGAALPIPGGMAMGAALASAIGAPSSSGEDIVATLTSNAQALAEAHRFELLHQEKMLELTTQSETAIYQADANDRASARARQVSLHDWTPNAIGVMVILLAFGFEGWIVTHGLPGAIDAGLAGRILGGMDAAALAFINFLYGSNRDSQRKTQMIADVGNAAAGAPITIQTLPQTLSSSTVEQSYKPIPGTQGSIYQEY